MAYRLIFTSAPRALTGARTGFCTVARSASMSEKLASMVEKCGAYDHEINHGDPVFSHKKINFAGETFHVLSRMVDSGADYTDRSNYIADHLVVSSEEINGLPSPAEIMLDKKDWHQRWDGDPKWLEDEKLAKTPPKYLPPSKNWESIFGDAGKAALLDNGTNPVIFARTSDWETLLKLFAESSSLQHPFARSWDFTFTTSLAKSENPADYNWKVYVNASAEKIEAAQNAISLISKTTPEAPETAAAKFARTANISNRDRLGLKVANVSDIRPKIHVARIEEKNGPSPMVIGVAIGTGIAILAVVLIWMSAMAADKKPLPPTVEKTGFPSFNPKAENADDGRTYSKVWGFIKDAIEQNRWNDALKIWDDASFENYNPKGRLEILSDIGKRADLLMDEAEAIYNKIPAKNGDAESKAAANLHAARLALELDGLPKKDERMQRWLKLEKLIKKS